MSTAVAVAARADGQAQTLNNIGLIYLDRKKSRPKLDQSGIKTVRLFRDFAVMAIRKVAKRRR